MKALSLLALQAAQPADTASTPLPGAAQALAPGSNAVVIAAIGIGLLYCFFGYRTLKVLIGLSGFVLAGAVAGFIAGYLSKGDPAIMGVAALVGGGCGAVALFFLYRAGIFILGSMAAGLIAHQILATQDVDWAVWAVLGAGFLGGAVALILERPVMTLATAALGAWAAVCGVAFFLIGPDVLVTLSEPLALDRDRGIMVLCWAVLSVAGVLAQSATRKRPVTDKSE